MAITQFVYPNPSHKDDTGKRLGGFGFFNKDQIETLRKMGYSNKQIAGLPHPDGKCSENLLKFLST